MDWLRERRWRHYLSESTVTATILVVVTLSIYGLITLVSSDPNRNNDQCQEIETESGWFSDIEVCKFELPNGIECYAVEFGNGGGLYCDRNID